MFTTASLPLVSSSPICFFPLQMMYQQLSGSQNRLILLNHSINTSSSAFIGVSITSNITPVGSDSLPSGGNTASCRNHVVLYGETLLKCTHATSVKPKRIPQNYYLSIRKRHRMLANKVWSFVTYSEPWANTVVLRSLSSSPTLPHHSIFHRHKLGGPQLPSNFSLIDCNPLVCDTAKATDNFCSNKDALAHRLSTSICHRGQTHY